MSELQSSIEEAQSFLADITQAVSYAERALDNALDAANGVQESPVNDALAALEDAMGALSSAEDNMPSEYSEVGSVGREADAVNSYLSDAQDAIRNAVSTLEDLL